MCKKKCESCGHKHAVTYVCCPSCGVYVSTQEEIAAASKTIQDRWSESERVRRIADDNLKPCPVEVARATSRDLDRRKRKGGNNS